MEDRAETWKEKLRALKDERSQERALEHLLGDYLQLKYLQHNISHGAPSRKEQIDISKTACSWVKRLQAEGYVTRLSERTLIDFCMRTLHRCWRKENNR